MTLSGFGNVHQSQVEPGILPQDQNSPQQVAKKLFAEQISGSAFTRQRHLNLHSWVYRRLPSVVHHDFEWYSDHLELHIKQALPPNPMRWSPWTEITAPCTFIDGLIPFSKTLTNTVYLYQCNTPMNDCYFTNQDGEMLIIPYLGSLTLHTEMGILNVAPGSILIIPRGIYFKVTQDTDARGYVCENMGAPLRLPELGVLGANGLANPRHFIYPEAACESEQQNIACLINKFQNKLWISQENNSPLNVLAWQGNYAPYSYDLTLFNTLNTVSYDHPDPSIFTVLTSESETPGVANLDFVIFPPRWIVADRSFRPPYFHKNVMSEFMGLINGRYDAKSQGFHPGGVSIHNAMCPHGPDVATHDLALKSDLKPHYFDGGLAFMLESKDVWQVCEKVYNHRCRQQDYRLCWQGFKAAPR